MSESKRSAGARPTEARRAPAGGTEGIAASGRGGTPAAPAMGAKGKAAGGGKPGALASEAPTPAPGAGKPSGSAAGNADPGAPASGNRRIAPGGGKPKDRAVGARKSGRRARAPNGWPAERIVRDRRAASGLPDEVAISYYEPERDYQTGLQRARRDGIALRANRIDLPAAIAAGDAKGAAEAALARARRERETATVRLPWRRMGVRAGEQIVLDGARWRIAGWTLERMALELSLVRSGPAAVAAVASPGRATGGLDAPAGTTMIELLDIPGLDGGSGEGPRLWLAAAGAQPGWRRATVSLSLDGGASWRTWGTTAPAATMGRTTASLAAGPRGLIDRVHAIEIELLHDAMALPGGGDAALLAGGNLALVGDELIGFADAVQTAPRRWRLSGLLRGRYGTEWAMSDHAAGDRVLLLESGRLMPIDLPPAAIGGPIMVSAQGVGDVDPVVREAIVIGRGLRPPAPVAIRARRLGDGTIRVDWIRRSRGGWAWLDGAEVPLGEDAERYRLTLTSAGIDLTVEPTAPTYDYVVGDQPAGLRAGTAPLTVTIAQVGRFGPSLPPASQTFTL
jgi:hypothetical protein